MDIYIYKCINYKYYIYIIHVELLVIIIVMVIPKIYIRI